MPPELKKGEKQTNQFIINFSEPTSYGYTAVAANYFVVEILNKEFRNDTKSSHILFRLFRTGILGDILYKKGQEYVERENFAETQFLATIFESYMFFVRTIYDYLLHFLKIKYGVTDTSFYNFFNKIKNGKYPIIKGRFREYLQNNLFEEIRTLRDSIKRQTPNIFIYVKNHKYHVEGTMYKRNGDKERFDELLNLKIFGYSTVLLLIMAYFAENITGVTFKEQTEWLNQKYPKNNH